MKETISVLVIEDNEYYSNLLSNALQQSLNSILASGRYQMVLHSFSNAEEYVKKIKSGELDCQHDAVFIDYYLGENINAGHVIKVLREHKCNALVVLLSQSKEVKEKLEDIPHDYFVIKDNLAPALCGLYLHQHIENKYSVSLDL